MQEIYQSLFVLHKCYFNTKLCFKAIEDHQQKGPIFKVYHFTQNLSHYIILEATSFLEEYNNNFTGNKIGLDYSDRINRVKRICKPIIKQILKWKDIIRFRNSIIAHPWRESDGKFISEHDSSFSIPRTWTEFQFLKDLITYVYSIIKQEFNKELEFSIAYMLFNSVEIKFMSREEINQDVLNIKSKIEEIQKRISREYDLTFNIYDP